MVETDCPYLAPVPFRGKRCEPAHTRLVAEEIAKARGASLEEIAAQQPQLRKNSSDLNAGERDGGSSAPRAMLNQAPQAHSFQHRARAARSTSHLFLPR